MSLQIKSIGYTLMIASQLLKTIYSNEMMKKLINLILLMGCVTLFSCKKDAKLTYLDHVGFSSGLHASATDLVFSNATDTASVVTFSWPAVTYPIKAPVTYTLQVDIPADTLGDANWGKATEIIVGDDALSKSFNGEDLNTLAIAKGLLPAVQGTLVFRMKSYMDRAAYTNAVSVNITPYQNASVLYIPGQYQGWNPASATKMAALKPSIYIAYVNFPEGDTFHFKFTNAPDWSHLNYGDGGSGSLTTDGTAGDLVVPGAGYYELSANLKTNKWTYTKTTWSILGDASPGGWVTDTQLTYDPLNQVWKVTCNMIAGGSFKFRANNAWVIDFGKDATGKLAYADSPVYDYNAAVQNLTVPSDGNYTIILDLHDSSNFNYTIIKN